MRLKPTLFCPLVFLLSFSLYAEDKMAGDTSDKPEAEAEAEVEEKELPEYSYPPYSVGDRAIIQGHYIPLVEDISLNFRILNNRMYVYWVDVDDLIVEPQALAGNVRFLAGVRGKNYYVMEPLQGEDGLGSVGGPVLEPHNFTIILSLKEEGNEEFKTYPTFRHSLITSNVREARTLVEVKDKELEDEKDKGYRGGRY